MSAVELFDFSHHAHIISGDKVDSNTLTTETSTTADTMDVVLTVGREIVVDDQRHLLDVDTTGKQVGGDQDTGRTGAELLHDDITLSLLHVTVHGGDSEVAGNEFVSEPVDLSTGVAENDSLGDGDGLVEIGEGIELPFFLLNGNVKLLDTFEGKFGLLDQDADGVAHELGGDIQDVLGHGSGQEDDLGGLGQELENVVDLLSETTLPNMLVFWSRCSQRLKTYRKHLIGLIEDEHLHVVGLEDTALDHVVDTARSTNNDLRAVLKSLHVLPDVGATNAGMALNAHEVTNGNNDLLDLLGKLTSGSKNESLAGLEVGVDLLEGGDGESGSLSGTRLSLSNHIGPCRILSIFENFKV